MCTVNLVETRGVGPCARYQHKSAKILDKIFVFGGRLSHLGEISDELWAL